MVLGPLVWLAATAVLVVLAVSICTAVGSEAEGPQVLAGEGLGSTRPGQWAPGLASWRRLGDLSLGASNVKSTGAVSAGAFLFQSSSALRSGCCELKIGCDWHDGRKQLVIRGRRHGIWLYKLLKGLRWKLCQSVRQFASVDSVLIWPVRIHDGSGICTDSTGME